jgi:hypothetical protein
MRRFLVTLALCSFVASCDDHHDSSPAECKEIIEACHEVDPGSGPIHECHENAEEEWSKEQCTANRQRCLALCSAPRDGGGQ